ncbi:MAG: DUF262 domain-containing HNH endonuclease family protein [Spirochaetia bacterium]|jgi:uncharacterized protein with ParB-like and HNH nuclease domain|nr:DUF262 domain-containing HNH endonuclease family protein [Spirochaetia bacterium]
MKAIQGTSNKTYRQIMGNGISYEVPKFQRDYTWSSENWDDLWQDIQVILSAEDSEHYMGYLVLQTLDNKKFIIIDGQQRLTTMEILILSVLKSLNDLVENNIDSDRNRQRIENLRNAYIGSVDPVTLIANNKLKLNRNSDDYYRQHLVLLKDLPIRNINTSEKHLMECFNWYYKRIKNEYTTGEDLAKFIDTFVDKLFFTVIEVSDQLNAFTVFETLNSRGVQLSSADLLKNYFFSIVDGTHPHISEIEELENIWNSIVGILGENKFDEYLRCFWNSYNKLVRKNELFKTIKKNIILKEQVFTLARSLRDAADIYLAIQSPNDEMWNNMQEARDAIRELQLFQIKQPYPLLISGYKYLSKEQFTKLIKCISVISFRYNIIGGLNPNEQEKSYNSAALNIVNGSRFNVHDLQPVYVPDSNFENDFRSKQFKPSSQNHKIIKYIFSKLARQDYESDIYTVEHILPRSAGGNWDDFDQDARTRSTYRIGNLTILEKKLNKDADTLPFTEKCLLYKQSNVLLTKNISENNETWNESKITARQNNLAKAAKTVWKIHELSKEK